MISFVKEKHVWISYFLFLLSSMLVSFTILCLVNLQSSFNIEAGLGVASLAVWAAFQVLVALLVKGICTIIHPKTALICSDVFAIPYIVANFYPKFYTLIPAAALFGIGRGIYWVGCSVFIAGYANMFAKFGYKHHKSLALTNAFFVSSYFSGQMFGNLVPYLVIETRAQINNNLDNVTGTGNFSTSMPTKNVFVYSSTESRRFALKEVCGANDCQDPSVISSSATNIVPPTPQTLRFLLGVLTAAYLIGLFLRAIFAPNFKEVHVKAQDDPATSEKLFNRTSKKIDKEWSESKTSKLYMKDDKVTVQNSNFSNKSGEEKQIHSKLKEKRMAKLAILFAKTKFSAKFLLNQHQLLLATLSLHAGSSLAFTTGEITRAFVSCVFGVKQIGIVMTVYGANSMLSSMFSGKLSAKFGRKVCVISACLVHTAAYCFCLLWKPDENANLGTVFGMLIAFGFADSVFMSMSTETLLVHFPNLVNGVFVSFQFWYCCGLCLQFAWSTFLCVKTKIYFMFFILYFGVSTYGIAEYKLWKKTGCK